VIRSIHSKFKDEISLKTLMPRYISY